MVLKPLHDAAGLRRVRVATYQSVSGAGSAAIDALRREQPDDHRLRMDWEFEGDEYDEEVKLRDETRKILELPDLPVSATCVRVPVVVGHAEAIWVETETPLAPAEARAAPGWGARPSGRGGPGTRGRHRDGRGARRSRPPRQSAENGLVLFLACDNLRKGAALNAIQIAESSFPRKIGIRERGSRSLHPEGSRFAAARPCRARSGSASADPDRSHPEGSRFAAARTQPPPGGAGAGAG